jgi:uncharacterized damage-inducible protein DinB
VCPYKRPAALIIIPLEGITFMPTSNPTDILLAHDLWATRNIIEACGAILTHATTHGMHHRAQCLNMLRHLGVTPLPQSSVIEWTWTADL